MGRLPAVAGGVPRFGRRVPVTRPTLATDAALMTEIRTVLESGMLTSARHVRAFEEEAAEFLGVADVVAVSSCTTGLMLTLRALGTTGDAVLPSFTFMATGHAAAWHGLTPVLADCDPSTYTLDTDSAAAALTGDTGAVIGVHTFGVCCDADTLHRHTEDRGIPLVLDAAHAFGARYPDGTMAGGKGIAEVFSLSPTKVLPAGEGGLVATRSTALAADLRQAREYGNPGDYDARMIGLNGRMTEINAVIGRAALRALPGRLAQRAELADRYRSRLAQLPGLGFQSVPDGATSTYKDFTVRIDAGRLGLTRGRLAAALDAENIDTRTYFDPPLHTQTAYRTLARRPTALPATESLSRTLLTLPLYSHMGVDTVDRICETIAELHEHSRIINAAAGDARGTTEAAAAEGTVSAS
ncbi:DegT/DnrJ/EryC1/StrS family aminotransferase [Streptomyces sp. NPDC032940]|uniref:DegT/DnrJ/EryC1/StrS family aminotransferase n=1 Tax=Streptomyces sp. NPDC032940 TaxID=3155366 RepID=UPI0033C1420B